MSNTTPRWLRTVLTLPAIAMISPAVVTGQSPLETVIERVATEAGVEVTPLGVTRRDTRLLSLVHREDVDYSTPRVRVLVVGGLDATDASFTATVKIVRWFYTDPRAGPLRNRFVLSAVPCANPDGNAMALVNENGSGGNPTVGYPPSGTSYNSPTDPEAAYLWRWIGMHAPDLVVEVRGTGDADEWRVPESAANSLAKVTERLRNVGRYETDDGLAAQLSTASPAAVGSIPALQLSVGQDSEPTTEMMYLLQALEGNLDHPSLARQEISRRLSRNAMEVATQLSAHYGHSLKQVAYIPAVALIGRLRLGQLTGEPSHREDVERIVEPYRVGDATTTPTSGSGLSGHLVFTELARMSDGAKRDRYVKLAQAAADLAFEADGSIRSQMPFHNEMSDAVFMGGPILAQVGELTGNERYYEACVRHIRTMRLLCAREDGLYRHSPLDEAAWGRGNGFPALGLAMSLDAFPEDHPDRPELLKAFREHLSTLVQRQDGWGTWHQVIDRPESYRELSCTCMITYAMIRGVRRGWLEPAQFRNSIERAWHAIKTRVRPNGELVDVCTGTGKQQSLRDYYDRTAILGKDPRGGAMALLVATEMAALEADGS